MARDREGSAPRGPDAHDYLAVPLRRQFDQRQMERQADPPQTDAYGMRGAACIGFDVIFKRAALEIVSQY
jgi:hypothetical protein